MNRHVLMMLIGCVLPVLLLFILPAMGLSSSAMIFLVIVLMFACHLLMMRGHGHDHEEKHEHHAGGAKHE